MSTITDLPKDDPCFQLVDESSRRPDLARRKEIKFAVPRADVDKLRHIFTGGCRAIAHNEAISTVRSVYFDDLRLSACRANIDGIGVRNKLRIRWYDALLPLHNFFLEIKWRHNRVTGKHRYHMRSRCPLVELSYRDMQAELLKALPEIHIPILIKYTEPIVLVEYKREHFHARDSDLRLTVDYEIAFYDQMGKSSISTSFRQSLHDVVVVEAKVPVGREHELKRIMYPFAARATRFSKYAHGCHLLGLVRYM